MLKTCKILARDASPITGRAHIAKALIRDHSEDDTLLRFVERFALVMNETGIPRMPARVFAFVLADDADRYTAGELASGLRVSRAAISGALKYLVQTGMLAREREPGARADTYRIYGDDVWSAITMQQLPLLERWEEALAEGVESLDPGRRGPRRLLETREYLSFMRAEVPKLVERWRAHRSATFGGPSSRPRGSA